MQTKAEPLPDLTTSLIKEIEPGCFDLSAVSITLPDTSNDSDNDSTLCAVCRNVDLQKLNAWYCLDHSAHYHLGPIVNILSRQRCPLCRLISSVYNSARLRSTDGASKSDPYCTLRTKVLGQFKGPADNFMIQESSSMPLDEPSGYSSGHNANTLGRTHYVIEVDFASSMDDETVEEVHIIQQYDEDLVTKETTPTQFRSRGRAVGARQVNFGLLKQWLHLCESSHGEACRQSYQHKTGPPCQIRLIDVEKLQIVDGSTDDRYIALSYVWGATQQMSLTSHNHATLRKPGGIKTQDLPRTIADAVELTRMLAERYLWIDKLCILQNDERDKVEQMSHMGAIYSAAALTIVSGAIGADSALPGVQPHTRPTLQHSEVVDGIRYITGQPDLSVAMRSMKWCTRGWTYQEGFLSARCLVFTPYQVYFRCMSEAWCEDSYLETRLITTSRLGNGVCHLDNLIDRTRTQRCAFYQYTDMVEGYSARDLALQTDALWAISGVTDAFEVLYPDGFVWGMPLQDMEAALLWRPKDMFAGSRTELHTAIQGPHMVTLPFPSWSWLACCGGVVYEDKCEEEVRGVVEWHPPAVYAVNPKNPLSSPWQPVEEREAERKGSPIVVMNEHALGTLRFTTACTTFIVDRGDCTCTTASLHCTIRAPETGKAVGDMWVPASWMGTTRTKEGEFALLSLRIENTASGDCKEIYKEVDSAMIFTTGIDHVDGCEHQALYNVMLLDWEEGPQGTMAKRVGVTRVRRENWEEMETERKMVVLH